MHLVAGSTTRPVLAQIARSELARPLVNASVERFSRANHVFFTCILLQSSILLRLFGCIRNVSGSAAYGVQVNSVNAVCKRMQMLNMRVRALCLSQRGFCAISARCIRTPVSWRVYEVEHVCRGAARVPGFQT